MKNYNDRIRELREDHDLTQTQVAAEGIAPSPALFIFSHCVYLIAKKPQMQGLSRGFNSFSYFPVFPLLFYHILTASARKISKRKSFSACRNIPATHLRRGVDFCR